LRVDGIHTTAAFIGRVLDTDTFRRGAVHTRFVEQFIRESSP
jgi:biotin carboxylase